MKDAVKAASAIEVKLESGRPFISSSCISTLTYILVHMGIVTAALVVLELKMYLIRLGCVSQTCRIYLHTFEFGEG